MPATDIDLNQAFIQHVSSLDKQSSFVSVSMTCKEQVAVSKTDTIESLQETDEIVDQQGRCWRHALEQVLDHTQVRLPS